ncbi:hypothetical protein VITFI_CDS1442 [Vitreoscilla filiformis]|jgi:uncharacterized protein (DUF4415 family)|uniref:BrnA antitoxin of type II toxin-antitoxin system n=1 Tax=Vitreoscilla filiformis TaxID=63 RepID=A0A221KEF9_VITFI|nr:BrnA antitoxin family protein [Vitreoscilla filiformis]ASM77220.1 hypothetical protein VITFI_CDS1442 [Vitreoscilla filiformis]
MAEVKMDAEMLAFANDVAESIRQAKRGEFAAVHTPEMVAGYKTRGRPVGTTKPSTTKQAVTIRYSPDVLAAFRSMGAGWQAKMDDALREWLRTHSAV